MAETLASLEGPAPIPQEAIAIDQAASDVIGSEAGLPASVRDAIAAAELSAADALVEAEAAARIVKAKKAAEVRWSREFDWEGAEMDEALAHLAELRAAAQTGAVVIEKRLSTQRVDVVNCAHCGGPTRVQAAKGSRSRMNHDTGLVETGYACSAACFLYMGREWKQDGPAKEAKVAQ